MLFRNHPARRAISAALKSEELKRQTCNEVAQFAGSRRRPVRRVVAVAECPGPIKGMASKKRARIRCSARQKAGRRQGNANYSRVAAVAAPGRDDRFSR